MKCNLISRVCSSERRNRDPGLSSCGSSGGFDRRGGGGGSSGGRGGGAGVVSRGVGGSTLRGPAVGESCGGRGCAMDRDTEQPNVVAVLYLKVNIES